MQIVPGQVFNFWDTNGRRSDVLNALKIYLEILREVKAEHPSELWAAYPRSIAQFVFYQKAIERSPEVFKDHPKYDQFVKKLGDKLPTFLEKEASLTLSTRDKTVLADAVEARARHYTSNLVKIGFTDSKRNESAVGAAFLNGSVMRDALEEILPIDDANLLVLRQLLKLRLFSKECNGRRTFYSPCAMALLLLLKNETLDQSTFLTVVQGLDPYLNAEAQKFIFDHIESATAVKECVWQTDIIQVPNGFQADKLLPEDIFSTYIRNKKSRRKVKVYYTFYKALYEFREKRDDDTYQNMVKILAANRNALQKAFGRGHAIFDIGRKGSYLSLPEFLAKNDGHIFLAEEAFNRHFYVEYCKSNRAADIREYSDTTQRLLGATGLFKFDPLPELSAKELLTEIFNEKTLLSRVFGVATEAEYEEYEKAADGTFMSNRTLTEILGYSKTNVNTCISKIEALLGVTGKAAIREAVCNKTQKSFIQHIESKYTRERILKLLPLFTNRLNDGQIKKEVNDTASVPTIYEFVVGIAWYYISGKDFDLYSSLNLTMNGDFEPVIHAGGGDGDIVIHYDDLAVMLEVTLMNKQAQKRSEWEPVLRHSLNLKASVEPKEAITFFIANELDHNTINIWRAVAAATLESTNTHKLVNGVVIMPFTTEDLVDMLERGVPAATIIDAVCQSFAKVPQNTNTEWKEQIMEQLLPAQ